MKEQRKEALQSGRRHYRRSLRLPGHDYTQPGAYFVTVCTYEGRPSFGRVVEGEMVLSEAGEIAAACWKQIPDHLPHVALDAFVIMPNHLHGILFLVGARHAVPLPRSSRPHQAWPARAPTRICSPTADDDKPDDPELTRSDHPHAGKQGIITKIGGDITNLVGYITQHIGATMLESLLGSLNSERVLLFMLAREEGYATEIARFFETDLYAIQRQLDKLERGGVLVSRKAGRTLLYTFNPRYPFLAELKALLEKALSFYPPEVQERLLMNRRRPRRRGKPL